MKYPIRGTGNVIFILIKILEEVKANKQALKQMGE